jgi:hypothetical protein
MSVVSTSPTSGNAPASGVVETMGFKPSMLVMEIGYDDDADLDLRDAIAEQTGEELVGEESDEVVDVVLLWYRDGDDDLTDTLVDAVSPLADDGMIWLLTPKRGREGYVEPSDIAEAASVAGLSQTSVRTVSAEWAGTRLVGRKSGGSKR